MPKAKGSRGPTKPELITAIANKTGLKKVQVEATFDALEEQIKHYVNISPYKVVIPGLIKISRKRKPPTHARQGRNPATGKSIMIKAKPARNAISVKALKGLKDMV